MKKILLSLTAMFIATAMFSATRTALFDGSWTNRFIWSGQTVPGNGDVVIVPSGRSVELTVNTATYTSMTVNVYGTFTIDNGAKLDMDENSKLNLFAGGTMIGINGGSKLRIGGNTVFTGDNTVFGPQTFNKDGSGPLPVELMAFNAKAEINVVTLNWTSAVEVNNDYYSIERSADGKVFEVVGRVKGVGNSSTAVSYTMADERPLAGTSYYRLRQTDYDGQNKVLAVISVSTNKQIDFTVFPNPSNGINTAIQFNSLTDELVSVTVIDLTGKEVFNKMVSVSEGVNSITLDAELLKGAYLVKTTNDSSVSVKRLIVE